jgi:uncharacterized membrane protein YeaQ/YmgE (transglycosylase-associated protein family)
MFEFVLWVGLGVLTGWIASLATRTSDHQATMPYVLIGIIGSVCGGIVGRSLGMMPFSGRLAINPSSLMTAWFAAVVCVVALSFFGRTSSS